MRSGPGGEGEVRGKKEEVPAHLLVVLARWEMVERMVVDSEGRSSSSVAAGEGVLVAQGGGSWVLEHHQAMRNTRTGSGEAMRGGGGGSTASSSSPAPMAAVDGVWAREGARGHFIGGEGEGGSSWECSAPSGGG